MVIGYLIHNILRKIILKSDVGIVNFDFSLLVRNPIHIL